MKNWILPAIMLLVVAPAWAQTKKPEPPPHFGIPAETEFYPQDSPKQAMASIAKALDRGRYEYLLAHLVDPIYTDATFLKFYRRKFGKSPEDDRSIPAADQAARVKEALEAFIAEVKNDRASEPKKALRLERLLKSGNVEESGTTARVTLKDEPGVSLTLQQIEGRWYMSNAK
jgi:hypothetical protein